MGVGPARGLDDAEPAGGGGSGPGWARGCSLARAGQWLAALRSPGGRWATSTLPQLQAGQTTPAAGGQVEWYQAAAGQNYASYNYATPSAPSAPGAYGSFEEEPPLLEGGVPLPCRRHSLLCTPGSMSSIRLSGLVG